MSLIHLIYSSAAKDPNFSKEDLAAILEQSRTNNNAADITGILLYDRGAFFQVLEGEQTKVERLFNKLKRDKRHGNVIKLISEPIDERAFGHWSMGYPKITNKELRNIEGLNDFFAQGKSFLDLSEGRAKTLLAAFRQGRWRS
jgi:hypothetical protein